MSRTKAELQRMIRAALGEVKADLIVTGGKLINVHSGEVLEGFEIAAGGGIAIVDHNRMAEKIDFPFGGIFSLDPCSVVGKGLRRFRTARTIRARLSTSPSSH